MKPQSHHSLTREAVLVHGIFNSGRVFRTMVRHLQKNNIQCHIIQLKPSWGGAPIESLAHQLDSFIKNRIANNNPFSLIGFSMGSLVCRYYLQKLYHENNVSHFFSICGPHHGTLWAWFWIGKGTHQMKFRSPFLTDLNNNQHLLKDIPTVSYRTPFDQVIIPSKSSCLENAENIVYPLLSHQWMPHSRRVINHIIQTIQSPSDQTHA